MREGSGEKAKAVSDFQSLSIANVPICLKNIWGVTPLESVISMCMETSRKLIKTCVLFEWLY